MTNYFGAVIVALMGYDTNYPRARGFVQNDKGEWIKPKRTTLPAVSVETTKPLQTAASMLRELVENTDEAKLNKTEKARLKYLEMLNVPCLNTQAITLKLAFDCRLTPDFSYVDENGVLTFEDVKGFQREDALIKMKVAARKFPEFRFVIVKRVSGNWEMQEVKP